MTESFHTESLSEKQLRLMELLKKQKQREAAAAPEARTSIPRRRPSDPLVLSFGQKRLWFIEQLQPGTAGYNVPGAVRLRGPLSPTVLQRCLDEIGRRHEILRTSFQMVNGEPAPVITERPGFQLIVTDLRNIPEDEREAEAARVIHDEVMVPFDMTRDPLSRTCLLRLGDEEHIFLLVLHHIICDIWSVGVFFRTMMALYDSFLLDRPVTLPELPIQYTDYAIWQQKLLEKESLEALLSYWKGQVEGAPFVLELPVDHPRPPVQSFFGGRAYMSFGIPLTESLKALGKGQDASLYMVLLAALHTLLYRYTGQESILVGVPMANRNRLELEGLIGLLFNALVLRGDMAHRTTFRELLGQIRERTLGAFNHQDLPFERLVEELRVDRDMSRNPVFQVLFAFQNVPPSAMAAHGLAISRYEVLESTSREDFELDMRETPDGLAGWFGYDAALFDHTTAERAAVHFRNLLDAAVSDPDLPLAKLPLLSAAERAQLLAWNDTAEGWEHGVCLHRLIEAQVERTPEAVAVVFEGEPLSYRELDERAGRLSAALNRLGVGPETLVGICAERSLELVVGLYGVLKAGGAYVPIDPSYPAERLAFMLADSAVPVLLTQERLAASLPAHRARVLLLDRPETWADRPASEAPAAAVVGPDHPAYMIYTSGSTGRPKGVVNIHRAIVNRLLWMQEAYRLGPADRVLQKTPFSFDVSVWEFFWPLLAGARLVVARPGGHQDPSYLVRTIAEEGITTLHFVPSMLQVFVEEPSVDRLTSLRTVVASGEALPADLVERFLARLPVTAELHNLYGPTEAAVDVTAWACRRGEERRSVPIGRPIANVAILLLDPWMGPVPVGVPGELHIGGVALARGYHGRPDLTAERFVPDPFGGEPGSRLYKTGDLARWRPTGEIEYLGRIDHQVKVRGFRIELEEIENALGQHPDVRQSVVLAQEAGPAGRALVAYAVADLTGDEGARALRAFLQERLPEYMVPAAFVFLEEMPLTGNGKIDRRTLLAHGAGFSARADFVAPRNPVEDSLAGIWAQILRTDRVGVYDNFFEMGGQSLLATQVVSRVREAFGVELPVRALFQHPTVAGMAEGIEIALLRGRGLPDALPMIRIPRDGALEPSFGQERFWFIDQLRPGLTAYNIFGAVRMRGQLHMPTLQRSFDELMRRHEVLRTTFAAVDGRPVQVIHPPSGIKIPVIDLRGLSEEMRPEVARRLDNEEPQYPFHLADGPLIRCLLLRIADDEHVLAVTAHHIVYDVWSRELLVRELGRLYEAFRHGRPSPLPELEIQYADFAWWQRRWLRGEVLESQLAYWKKQLAGVTSGSELPGDRPRPPVQSFRGARVLHALPAATTAELKELSKRQGVTLFMTLLAAFDTFLHLYTGEEDIVVGSPIANRNRAETEALIGFFVNTQVLRTDLSGRPTFRQLLGRVRETALNAYAHQDLAFEQLVTELRASRDPARQPLFQVLFNFLTNYKPILMELPGLTLSPEPNHSGAVQFDLTCSIYEADDVLHFSVDYSTDLFERSTVVRLMEHYQVLLEGLVADPDAGLRDLSLLTAAERAQLAAWNDTAAGYPDGELCLHELVQAQVERTPGAVAVVYEGRALTYRELDERASALAAALVARGVGAETLVGVCAERSLELVVGLVGVLKAGGAYVPLDPDYPAERLAFMLEDAAVSILLTQSHLVDRLPAHQAQALLLDRLDPAPAGREASRVDPGCAAYAIFTSGSTGHPKGAVNTHRGIVNRLLWMQDRYGLTAEDRVLQKTPFSFDVSVWEFFWPLMTGARLVVARPGGHQDPVYLRDLIVQEGITTLHFVPSMLQAFVELPEVEGCASLRRVMASGEALPPDLAARVLSRMPEGVELHNLYGPTEAAVDVTYHACRPGERRVPIGRPVANTRIHLLGREGGPVPVGAAGELFIGGVQVARGYLHRADLTAERFVPDPFAGEPGARLYRSGDLARRLPGGEIEYLGRIDHQVKIRGFRIELGEIEAILCSHRAVREAVVVAIEAKRGRGDDEPGAASPGYHRLAACLVLQPGEPEPQAHALRTFLKERLPEYMIPSGFAILSSLPLTPNGKVDRRALAATELSRLAPETAYVAPRTPIEESLAQIWAELLEVERVGVHDRFFDLGGHSLLTTSLVSRIRDAFQLEVPLHTFFEDPTVAGLAEGIELARWADEVAQEPVAASAAGGDFEEGEL